MSRVLSLSLADRLYEKVAEHAKNQGMTVYQYVRRAVEMEVAEDDYLLEMLTQYDDESDE